MNWIPLDKVPKGGLKIRIGQNNGPKLFGIRGWQNIRQDMRWCPIEGEHRKWRA